MRHAAANGASAASAAADAPADPRHAGPPDRRAERVLGWIRLLSSEIGPRRPTSRSERLAAERMRSELARAGLQAHLESFAGYSTFALPYGLIAAAALLSAALSRRHRLLRTLLGAGAATGLAIEGGLTHTPLSRLLSRRPSQNVVATIEPRDQAIRTLCLVSHLDSSRSGLMFHPAFVRYLSPWISAQSLAVLTQATAPALERLRLGRGVLAVTRAIIALALALLIERELRGEDVPGASDNASGAAIAAQLATECAARPPERTRVVLLMTGCEEAGLLGAQSFLRDRDTSGWLFLNFDSLGGPATLRYLRREGVIRKWGADPALIRVAEVVSRRRPDLMLEPTDRPAGLTYDVSAVLARGERALTFSAQDATIPNLHWPTDTYENIDPDVIGRALEAGRVMIAAIDAGAADEPGLGDRLRRAD